VDPNGKAVFTAFLASGGTFEDVAAKLIGSPEYTQTRGTAAPAAFLNVVYQDVLNRPVDPTGRGFWEQQLNAGQTREQVARAILSKGEYRSVLVQLFYQQYQIGRASCRERVEIWVV